MLRNEKNERHVGAWMKTKVVVAVVKETSKTKQRRGNKDERPRKRNKAS